jgi:hypothetical protein
MAAGRPLRPCVCMPIMPVPIKGVRVLQRLQGLQGLQKLQGLHVAGMLRAPQHAQHFHPNELDC